MKSPLLAPLSSDKLWEFSFFLTGAYLVFFPCLSHPQSTAVALGAGFLLLLLRPIPIGTAQLFGKPVFFFLAYLLLSSIWSLSPGCTLQSAGLVFLGVLLYAMAQTNDLNAQGRMEIFGLGLAIVVAVMGLYEYFYGFEQMKPLLSQMTGGEQDVLNAAIHNRRASGPFVTQGALAAFLILFIPLAVALWASRVGARKVIYGFLALVLLAGLLATQSVGALACLALAAVLVLLKRRSKTAVALVVTGAAVGLILLIAARGTQSWLMASLGTRLTLWQAALGLFFQHPLLGTGLGTFDEAYQAAGLPLVTGARFPHNILLQLLVETGGVGLALFLAAIWEIARRLKVPSRWEGWGVGAGILAFLLFSLLDLPFQMPEVVWFFAVVAARLDLRPAKTWTLPTLPHRCVEYGLLLVFLISGFWPPLRAWNFALVAGVLWVLAGYFGQKLEALPLWVFAGTLFLALRAFFSPSALGTVWFFEIAGVALAFYWVLPSLEKPERFIKWFFTLGLVWAIKVWWVSFHYAEPGFSSWIHFQYSDVKEWMIFPNPKQVAIFLVPLVFFLWKKPRTVWADTGIAGAFLTMLRLKSFSGLLGMGAGALTLLKSRSRVWVGTAALGLGGVVLFLRSLDPSPTKWERLNIWASALRVWVRSPWVGVGPGAFAGYFHQVKFPRATGVSRYLMDAQYTHNEFLELLTAFGLIGFIFGMALLIQAWRKVRDSRHRAGLAALSATSFVDFCLHTPLIALQGVALLVSEKHPTAKVSPAGAFLALGLSVGLFGAPVFANVLRYQAETNLSQKRFLKEDLRGLEAAERLNSWDDSLAAARADYLEKLFAETKDQTWKDKSDEAFERVLDLEKADGQRRLEKAERLTERLDNGADPVALQEAEKAWAEAEEALPLNAFINFERGFFLLKESDKEEALLEFKRAVEKEPNYAAAWVDIGLLLKEKGDQPGSRQAFQTALEVYNRWKDAQRIDVLERQMVYLSPATVESLEKEMGR